MGQCALFAPNRQSGLYTVLRTLHTLFKLQSAFGVIRMHDQQRVYILSLGKGPSIRTFP